MVQCESYIAVLHLHLWWYYYGIMKPKLVTPDQAGGLRQQAEWDQRQGMGASWPEEWSQAQASNPSRCLRSRQMRHELNACRTFWRRPWLFGQRRYHANPTPATLLKIWHIYLKTIVQPLHFLSLSLEMGLVGKIWLGAGKLWNALVVNSRIDWLIHCEFSNLEAASVACPSVHLHSNVCAQGLRGK